MPFRPAVPILAALSSFLAAFACGQTPEPARQPGPHPLRQRFVCNVGYSPVECQKQMQELWEVLSAYHAERLEEWTWILVRSADWRQLTEPRHLDPQSPAFTLLERRETFFEEALVAPVPVRRAELLVHWSRTSEDLLRLAVTHELGHALCKEENEYKADATGARLRRGENVKCR